MTQEQALTPFEGLESFRGYTEEEMIVYSDSLLMVEQNQVTGTKFIPKEFIQGTMENMAYLRFCKDRIETIYNYAKQFVIAHVEEEKGIVVFDGKFSVANKMIFDYSPNAHWLSIKNDEKELAEYRKQLEKVCQTGGDFDGKKVVRLECKPEKELRFLIEK